MSDSDNGTKASPGLENEELVQAIAQTIVERLDFLPSPPDDDLEVIANHNYPRYETLVLARMLISIVAGILLLYSALNTFHRLPNFENHFIELIASAMGILLGLTLITLLVFEVFLGAGVDVELHLKKGKKTLQEYQFIPSLNKLPSLLLLLGLGFLAIIFGFASFYAELLRQDARNFDGLEEGFISVYFSIVTFSTVGYGDIHPASVIARMAVICEIFIAMFFSLIALSTTLSWVTAYERQQHDLSIKQRIQDLQKQRSAFPSDNKIIAEIKKKQEG